jgi:transcriptional regulator with XRE-family HTH domain
MTGQEFRELRTSNGLLQRELSELLGVSERQIQRWEASTTVPAIAEYALIGVSTILDHDREDAA